jgi:hypothetical protein
MRPSPAIHVDDRRPAQAVSGAGALKVAFISGIFGRIPAPNGHQPLSFQD